MHKFLAASFIFISFTGFGQAKRALNLLDKLKYDTAFELLENGLEKDTASAAIPFVLAKLYLVKQWPQSNLDSAFYFSLLSLTNYDLLAEKQLDKHIKDGFGKTKLVALKKEIDHLSFMVSKTGGAEVDYQRFIDQHPDAIDIDSAIYLRNQQAFLTTQKINTLNSYKLFLERYPKASDWQKANDVYQTKLYKESTASGKLMDYEQFVFDYPQSPYYEACTQAIYAINVGKNNVQALLTFISNYPNTEASKKAVGLLYHLHIAQEPASTFADKYPKLTISDSLKIVIALQNESYIPFWQNGLLQLVNTKKQIKTDSLTAIDFATVGKDYFSVERNGTQQLIGKNGEFFFKGEWSFIREENKGAIILDTEKGAEFVHKNGDYFSIGNTGKLARPFIAYKAKILWGLKSITNKVLTQAIYDSIWVENDLIFLKSKEKISTNLPEIFYPALDGNSIQVNISYEEYEWLTDSLLWVADGDKEGLFSADLEQLVPLKKHRIDLAAKGWSITNKKGALVPHFYSAIISNFNENSFWQLGSLNDSLLVKYKYTNSYNPDKAYLLGPSAIIMTWNDSSFVYLLDTIRFYKPKGSTIKPLLNQHNKAYYYEVTEGKKRSIINGNGNKLDLPKFKKVIALNQQYFQLETVKHKSLYNSNGALLLKDIDGVSMVNDSIISILKNQRFGLFMPDDSIYIKPSYDSKLIHLVDSFWVFQTDNRYGLINLKNKIILPSEYDKITYWTNNLAFLKKDLKWLIYNLKTKHFIETGIITYESITQNNTPSIRYQKGVGMGIFDSQKGVVLKPTFTNVYLEGTSEQPYYRAEKQVEEAALHIMLYYNLEGELLFKNIMSDAEFELLYGILED